MTRLSGYGISVVTPYNLSTDIALFAWRFRVWIVDDLGRARRRGFRDKKTLA